MIYDPPTYWTARGATFEDEARIGGWWDVDQAEEMIALLRRYRREWRALAGLLDGLRFRSILEVGCGFGRIGAALVARYPEVEYTGIDVSPDLCNASRLRLPNATVLCADLVTFDTDERWDVVLDVGCLSHLLPADVPGVIAKMRRWARRDIVSIDWDEPRGASSYQFVHDYRALYGNARRTDLGRTAMYHVTVSR